MLALPVISEIPLNESTPLGWTEKLPALVVTENRMSQLTVPLPLLKLLMKKSHETGKVPVEEKDPNAVPVEFI